VCVDRVSRPAGQLPDPPGGLLRKKASRPFRAAFSLAERPDPAFASPQMVRFSIFGIPVEIQPWFWLVLGLFGSNYADGSSAAGVMTVAVFVLAGFLSVFVHELGHALTGKAFGAATAITLHAFGGYATFPAGRFTRGQDFLVTAAGPAIQIVLGIVGYLVLRFVPIPGEFGRLFFFFLFWISIFWAVLNLIPVIPLDGGRLMASILGPRRIGVALQVSLVAAIVVGGLMMKFTASLFFPIMLGMMAYQNWQEYQRLRGR